MSTLVAGAVAGEVRVSLAAAGAMVDCVFGRWSAHEIVVRLRSAKEEETKGFHAEAQTHGIQHFLVFTLVA